MTRAAAILMVVLVVTACDTSRRQTPEDSIPGLQAGSQRRITRADLGWQWPLQVGRGTLGCDSGAIVFRTAGVTYAVNPAATARGFASIDPIRLTEQGALPSNPLSRLPQDERMLVFARAASCNGADGPEVSVRCRQRLRERHGLTQPELDQIEYEGRERRWPPLSSDYKSLEPLIGAAAKLCQR